MSEEKTSNPADDFAAEIETADRVAGIYFDDALGRYWLRPRVAGTTDLGEWVALGKETLRTYLELSGRSRTCAAKEPVSSQDLALLRIETQQRVAYAGPLAGWRTGLHETAGGDILVTEELDLLEPMRPENPPADPEDHAGWGWPTISVFLAGLLTGVEYGEDEEGARQEIKIDQRPYWYGWHQYFLQSLYAHKFTTDMACAIAGMPMCGKSLLKQLVTLTAGGVSERPYRYMTGQDNFNAEFLGAALLEVDDESAATDISSRRHFAAEIKQVVASGGMRIRAMRKEARLMRPIHRLFVALNLESDRLMVLPPIDADMRDKMLIFKGYSRAMPMPVDSMAARDEFWAKLVGELPYYVHWLLNVWETPADMRGRWSVKPWQHPHIYERLSEMDPCYQTWEFITRQSKHEAFYQDVTYASPLRKDHRSRFMGCRAWWGSAADLRALLISTASRLSPIEQRDVKPAQYIGDHLGRLMLEMPDRIFQSRTKHQRLWIILETPEGQS